MTTLTSSSIFAIADAPTVEESVSLTIISGDAAPGTGRLVHPTLGTYDYARGPDEWTNMDTDAIIAPIWASTKTMGGAANVLWPGYLRDVEVEERWVQSVAAELEHLRMLLQFWMNPPDPADGFVEWYPTYHNALGFQVAMVSLTAGGQAVTLHALSKRGWVRGPIVLRMRIIGRA